jgi:hypothetical protein
LQIVHQPGEQSLSCFGGLCVLHLLGIESGESRIERSRRFDASDRTFGLERLAVECVDQYLLGLVRVISGVRLYRIQQPGEPLGVGRRQLAVHFPRASEVRSQREVKLRRQLPDFAFSGAPADTAEPAHP